MMVARDANDAGDMVMLLGAFEENASGTAATAPVVGGIAIRTTGDRA